jgi:iron complex outermembrane receptor protein
LELSFEKIQSAQNLRFTVFGESVKDAILAQLGKLSPGSDGLYSYWQNVEKVHAYGIELADTSKNVALDGLDLTGQITRVWSRVDASASTGAKGTSVVGNPLVYVSPWRAMAMATYRPNEKWTYNISGRYQKAGASSLDNNDTVRATYQGFESFFVVDTKVRYKFDKQWTASAGIDNLLNRDYWIYHPFPQRTFVANLKYVH